MRKVEDQDQGSRYKQQLRGNQRRKRRRPVDKKEKQVGGRKEQKCSSRSRKNRKSTVSNTVKFSGKIRTKTKKGINVMVNIMHQLDWVRDIL